MELNCVKIFLQYLLIGCVMLASAEILLALMQTFSIIVYCFMLYCLLSFYYCIILLTLL